MAAEYRTKEAVKAAAAKRTQEGVVFVPCTVCGTVARKWKSNLAKAKWPITCSRKCRGKLMTGPGNPRYRGKWIAARSGYMMVRPDLLPAAIQALIPKGVREVPEHRAVMAEILGRWPTPKEHIHHLNGDKLDNRPENLQILGDQAHSREHRKVLRRLAELEAQNKILLNALALTSAAGPPT